VSEPHPAIGVSVLVFDRDGRVLLVRRGRPPAAGTWHGPGGRLEAGESLTHAALREVAEETGLTGVRLGPVVAMVERRLEGFHYLIVDFLGRVEVSAPPLRVGDDARAAAWVAPEEWLDYDLAEGLLPILRCAYRLWQGRRGGLVDTDGRGTDFVAEVEGGEDESHRDRESRRAGGAAPG